ncbi:Pectate lyase superfamily protein [Planctomycetes bacterium K23_9]|uniref:Pectate lyase superfamily protein n=2 Tax=Stieleria marina TaxID=1930275 RepID=A0A517NZR6_9BACT|nr:Pectate lyase superfamily protein [Planctomycetes bacterium K23_9]
MQEKYKIVGDGMTDDTAAIQAAVDAGVSELRFGKGTYRISKTITIDLSKVERTAISGSGVARFRMEGAGPAFRFVGSHDGTAAPHTIRPDVWNRESSPMVDGIEIVGKHPLADGISASGTMQLTITRVVVRDARHGIHLTDRNRNVIISECHLYDNHGIGVFMDRLNLHQINLTNCHISYNDGGGVVARNSEIRNLHIGTCDIEGNMGGPDAPPSANVDLDSTNSSVAEIAIVGCTIQHSHDAKHSANIRINGESTKRPFTDETRHGHVTIASNVLSDVQVNIELKNVRGATISGNTIWKGYQRNLVAKNCQSIVMTGNSFDRNPRYHYGDGREAKRGVIFTNCKDCTLSGNQLNGIVHHEAAMVFRQCQRINANGLSILDYGQVGLLLQEVVDSQFSGCLIRDDRKSADGISIRLVDVARTKVNNPNVSHQVIESSP